MHFSAGAIDFGIDDKASGMTCTCRVVECSRVSRTKHDARRDPCLLRLLHGLGIIFTRAVPELNLVSTEYLKLHLRAEILRLAASGAHPGSSWIDGTCSKTSNSICERKQNKCTHFLLLQISPKPTPP